MRLKFILTLSLFLTFATRLARAEGPRPLELKIKAAYLVNFGRYVMWPEAATSTVLQICIVGQDPFGTILDRTTRGRKVQERAIAVKRISSSANAAMGCDIAYLSPRLPESEQRALLDSLASKPVLTVGDRPRFLDAGGIVNFMYKADTIRFEVNLEAARKAGLDINSRVLAIAVSVRGEDVAE